MTRHRCSLPTLGKQLRLLWAAVAIVAAVYDSFGIFSLTIDKHRHSQEGFPKVCIFCGCKSLTAEDYWPKWLQRFLPSPFNSSLHTTTLSLNDDKPMRIREMIINRNKGPLQTPLKVVCHLCNNRWMSNLQRETSTHLKPLIDGNWVEFTERSQALIAAWATMFVMVYDFADMVTQNVTQSERTLFKDTKLPPPNWIISIGRMLTSHAHGEVWKRSFGLWPPPTDAVSNTYNFQSTTFSAGRLLLNVVSNTSEAVITPQEIGAELRLEVVWPTVNWPIQRPARSISAGAGFTFVATGIDRVLEKQGFDGAYRNVSIPVWRSPWR